MKIIHCADLHIDSCMESNFSREQAKQRKEEIICAYEDMVLYANEHKVDVIIFAGDVFDKSKIGKRARNRFLAQIINNPHIDFFYLRGNHDNVSLYDEEDELPSNLFVFNNRGWKSKRYDNVVITGVELDKQNNKGIYGKLILNSADINIVTLHGQESIYDNDKTEVINLTALKNRYIDYLALGHIHKYKRDRLDNRGIYCYSGCLSSRGFDECGRKGFVVLDINEDGISDEFIDFTTREFHEVSIDVSGVAGILATEITIQRINESISSIPSEDVVKIILCGDLDIDTEIDISKIKSMYKDRFYFMKIYDKTRVKIDFVSYENDQTLKGEFVRLMRGEDIPEELKNKIIELGLKSLRGEELEL